MLFIINDLKYDTDKMELISNKCKWQHEVLLHWNQYRTTCDVNAILYKSIHNRWLATYKYRGNTYAAGLYPQHYKFIRDRKFSDGHVG